jgi:two-component system chemotaxis sensor kinase CheA
VLNLRGKPLPYLRLRHVLPAEQALLPRQRESVVVVRHGEGLAGLAVDALLGECQTVLKPLGRAFQRVPGVSASAVLGDGRVALVLEIAGLLGWLVEGDLTAGHAVSA